MMIALPFLGHSRQGRDALGGVRRLHPAAVGVHEAGADRAGGLDVRRGPEGRGRAGRLDRLRPLCPRRWRCLLIEPDVGQTVLITIAFGAAFFMAGVPMTLDHGAGRRGGGRARQHLFRCSSTWPAGSTSFLSPRQDADTHQVDRAAGGHRRRRPVRPRARARGCMKRAGARRAHRLHLFGRGRGVRPGVLADPDRALRASCRCAASTRP